MAAFDRALVLFKREATFRTDSNPTKEANAFLVTDPEFETDIQRLERTNARSSLSPQPSRVGRITSSVKFKQEVVGSGTSDASARPIPGDLLRACGFAETAYTNGGFIQSWHRQGNKGKATLTEGGGSYIGDTVRYAEVRCLGTAGGDGVAQVSVTAPTYLDENGDTVAAYSSGLQTAQSGTPINGPQGSTIIIAITEDLALNDTFVVQIAPPGYLYSPVSTGFESGSARVYYDGLLHSSKGCRGTVSMNATAGQQAMYEFTFTGDWVDPVDAVMPEDAVYHELQPPQVELADVRVDNDITSCPSAFGFDLANDVTVKECANEPQGYAGALIVGRSPSVTFDPSFGPEANYAYWNKLQNAAEIDFSYTIGTERGNSTHVLSHVQLRTLGYGDRAKQRVYNVEADAVSRAGNDELSIYIF